MNKDLHNIFVVLVGMITASVKELSNHNWSADLQTIKSAVLGAVVAYIVYHLCDYFWNKIRNKFFIKKK